MSIIYDALQKIQQSREKKREGSRFVSVLQGHWLDTGISFCIAVLMAVLAVVIFPTMKTFAEAFFVKPVVEVVPSVPPPFNEIEYKAKNSLNGVFISHDEKTALINNQFYNEGDNVDGMKIISIKNDGVMLKNNEATLVLRVAS